MQGDMKDSRGCQQERLVSKEGSPRCATNGEENAPLKEPCESPLSRQDGTIPPAPKGRIYHIRDERVQALRAKVQVPNEGVFDRKDLKWEAVQNYGRGQVRNTFQAVIPWNRLWDFVEGESTNYDFPCKFLKVPLKRVQKPGQAENPRDSSALQKIRFHCEYGPEDKTLRMKDDDEKIIVGHLEKEVSIDEKNVANGEEEQATKEAKDASKTAQEVVEDASKTAQEVVKDASKIGQKMIRFNEAIENEVPPIVPPSSPKRLIRRRASRVQAGKSKKRGCLCQFDAKQLYLDSTLCTIQFHCMDHVNEQGKSCHGRSFANVWEGNGEVKSSLVNHASRKAQLSEKLLQDVLVVMSDIESLVRENSDIRAYALSELTATRDKLIALASTGLPHPRSQSSIPLDECNNQTQCQNSPLKGSSHKKGVKKRARAEQ